MEKQKKLYNFEYGNATDIGKKRKVNEDYFANFDTKNGYVFLVCDGMGGHKGGEKASRIAIQAIKGYLLENTHSNIQELLKCAFSYANREIIDYALRHTELKGMGSTCVALLINNSNYYYAHVGDSRLYYYSGSKFNRLTKDHSFVQSLVDLGEISENEAAQHPRKNEINNVLGIEYMKPATVCQSPLKPQDGDFLLLCTDGLYGMVSDEAMRKVLINKKSLTEQANELIWLANEAGGDDNITLQIIKVGSNMLSFAKNINKTISSINKKIILLLVFIAGFGFGIYFLFLYNNPILSENIKNIISKNYPTTKQQKISEIFFVVGFENKPVLKNVVIENTRYVENIKEVGVARDKIKVSLRNDPKNNSGNIEVKFNGKNIVFTFTIDDDKLFLITHIAIDGKDVENKKAIQLNNGLVADILDYSIRLNKYKYSDIDNPEDIQIIITTKNKIFNLTKRLQ
jgi:serine/threonine protein phosphatase PrpC